MPARSQAQSNRSIKSAPLRPGVTCIRITLCPKAGFQAVSRVRGISKRSRSQSTAAPESRPTACARAGSACPPVFAMTSAAKRSAVSKTPRSDWSRVPTAHNAPSDMLVLPRGNGSLSRTTTSQPASCAASAATNPQAPAPAIRIGTVSSKIVSLAGSSVGSVLTVEGIFTAPQSFSVGVLGA